MPEPKIKSITTKKGTVFGSMEDYRNAAAKAGVDLSGHSDQDLINDYTNRGDIKVEYEPETQQPPNGKVPQGAAPPTGTTAPPPGQEPQPESAVTGKGIWSMVPAAFGTSEKPGIARTAWQLGMGFSGLPGAVLALPGLPPLKETAKVGSDILEGAIREGVLSIPGQAMSIVGIDPSKIEVPYAPKFKSRKEFDEFIRKGGKAWQGPSDTTPSDLVTGEAEKKKGEKETFRSIGEAPPGPAGQLGGMIGTGLQFYASRGKLGMPQLEAKTFATARKLVKNPIIADALAGTATSIADGVLTAAQSFSKTMDPSEALSNAGWATLIDMGVKGIPSAVKTLIDTKADVFGPQWHSKLARLATWDFWSQSALPRIEKLGKDPLEYQRTLANKMGERKYDFTKSGAARLKSEFETAASQMKKTSSEADEVLGELYKMKAIPPEALRPVDYGAEVRNAIYGLEEDGKPLFKKVIGPKGVEIYEPIPGGFAGKQIDADALQRVRSAAAKIDEVMPKEYKVDANGNAIPKYELGKNGKPIVAKDASGNPIKDSSGNPVYKQKVDKFGHPQYETTDKIRSLDFEQAEFYKERINSVIKELYDSGVLNPADKIDKQVKLLYGNAIRKAQQKAFDLVEQTKNTYGHFIPASSPIKRIRPGYLNLPWINTSLKYSDGGKEAMELADLSTVARMAQHEFQPHLGAKSAGEMQKMIGIAQFIHGSILTPSQLASAHAEASTAVGASLRAKRLMAISNLAGKTASASPAFSKGFAGAKSTTPPSMSEWVQQQAAPTSQENQWTIEQ